MGNWTNNVRQGLMGLVRNIGFCPWNFKLPFKTWHDFDQTIYPPKLNAGKWTSTWIQSLYSSLFYLNILFFDIPNTFYKDESTMTIWVKNIIHDQCLSTYGVHISAKTREPYRLYGVWRVNGVWKEKNEY